MNGTSKNSDLLRANPDFLKGLGESKRGKISIIKGLLKNKIYCGMMLMGLIVLSACAHQSFPANSKEIRVLGKQGAGAGEFNEPFAIAIGKDDSIYVADARNHRIQMFSEAGEFKKQWGGQGAEPGKLERPAGIAVDSEGNVYVSDFELDRIQKFDAEEKFLLQWGKGGKGHGEFNSPAGLAINSQNELFVTDTYNHRIQKFDAEGRWLQSWGEYHPISVVRSFLIFSWNQGPRVISTILRG